MDQPEVLDPLAEVWVGVELGSLFRRDLLRLGQQIEAFPEDADLWKRTDGVANPAGNLVLHLEGNLREYIGRQLGGLPFERDRPEEFASRGISRSELITRIASLLSSIPEIVARLAPEELGRDYPEKIQGQSVSTGQFLIHLYGHLNWHLGQIDIIRRVHTGRGALEPAGL
jgi:hypothetical protein